MKIPKAKVAFDKRSDKPEKLPVWQVEEVKSLKEVIERHKKRGEYCPPKRPCRATRRPCEGRFRLERCLQRARTFSVSNDVDYQHAQDKQVTQHQLTPKSKWRTLQPCLLPKSECPDIWIRLPRHMCPKTRQDIPLERNLYGHPLAALLWDTQFEKVLLGNGLETETRW